MEIRVFGAQAQLLQDASKSLAGVGPHLLLLQATFIFAW